MIDSTPNAASMLIVEDDAVFRNFLAATFDNGIRQIHLAEDGQEALEFLDRSEGKVDLMVTDIQMPRRSGLELVSDVHDRGWSFPIVAMTGSGDKDLVIRLLRLGVEDFLEKPFQPFDVRSRVDAVFSRYSRRSGVAGLNQILDRDQFRLDRHPEEVRRLIERVRDQLDARVAKGDGLVSLEKRVPQGEVGWRLRKVMEYGGTAACIQEGEACSTLFLARPDGHDRQASELGVMVRILFESSYPRILDPEEFLRQLGRILFQQHAAHPVEALCIQLDASRSTVTTASAGFPSPVLIPFGGGTRRIAAESGRPLGIDPNVDLAVGCSPYRGGDRILATCSWIPRLTRLHPTGAALALGSSGLDELIPPHRSKSLDQMVEGLWSDALAYSGWNSREDLLLVGIQLSDAAVQASPR